MSSCIIDAFFNGMRWVLLCKKNVMEKI